MARAKGGHRFSAKWNKFASAFSEALIDCGEQLTKQGETVMIRGCEEWLKKTDAEWPHSTTVTRIGWGANNVSSRSFGGDHDHPWYTGQLHDSVAVRVADGNRIIATRYMPAKATGGPQTATAEEAGRDYDRIVGQQFGILMAGRASRVAQKGTNAQMFIGAPYAQWVNEQPRHEGFINELNVQFISFLEDYFSINNGAFRNLLVRPRK